MVTEKKFAKLKPITQLKKIADELKGLRHEILSGIDFPDFSSLISYLDYCKNLIIFKDICVALTEIIQEKRDRELLEKIHFLYHEIMEKIGYPISEKQFIQKRGDRIPDERKIYKSELIIVLDNLRSAFNVGSIIRLGECLGVKKIIAGGLTPGNSHPKVIKTAKGCQNYIDFEKHENISDKLLELKKEGYQIVAVETTTASKNINEFSFKEKTVFIFGNEEIGICQKNLDIAEEAVVINMKGFKNSLNVANAASIAVYEYNRQRFR